MPRSFGVWKLDQKRHSPFAAPFYHVKLFGPGVNSFEPSQKIVKLQCEKDIQDHKSCYLRAINVVTGEQIVRVSFHVRADMLEACAKLRVIMSSDVSPDQLPIRVKFLIVERFKLHQGRGLRCQARLLSEWNALERTPFRTLSQGEV